MRERMGLVDYRIPWGWKLESIKNGGDMESVEHSTLELT